MARARWRGHGLSTPPAPTFAASTLICALPFAASMAIEKEERFPYLLLNKVRLASKIEHKNVVRILMPRGKPDLLYVFTERKGWPLAGVRTRSWPSQHIAGGVRSMMGERLRAIVRWGERHAPIRASEKAAHNPRESMTGALAGLFGAIVLLTLIASGLVLRPAAKRPVVSGAPAVTADTPSAPASETSAPVPPPEPTTPPADIQATDSTTGQDVEPASTRRSKHTPKGGKAVTPTGRGVRKNERHRDLLPVTRDAP